MASFNSDADRKKWQSLQHSAGTSLNAIVQGRATNADFQRVATILSGLNGLAANVFATAVSAAEVQAKKFEAQYESIAQDRDTRVLDAVAKRDEASLTAYEMALNAALAQIAPDIIGSVKEIIEMSVLESNEELSRTMGGRFTDLEGLLPSRDLPTVNDLLTANDLLAEQLSETDDRKWAVRESSLIEKIADTFRSVLRDLAESMRKAKQSNSYDADDVQHRNVPRLAAPSRSPAWEIVDDTPLLTHAKSMVGGREMAHASPRLGGMSVSANEPDTRAMGAALPAAREASIALSSHAEQAITTAANDQSALYAKLLDFLTGPAKDETGGTADPKDDKDESEKADTWWRSFRNWTGDLGKKYKDFKKDNGGWLSALGTTLALMLLDPQLFKTFGALVEQYLTWDNLKKTVGVAWDWVSKEATSVVDWVLDKLGISTGPEKDPKKKKEQENAADDAAAGGAYIPVNSSNLDKDGKPIKPQMGPPKEAMNTAQDVGNAYSTAFHAVKSLLPSWLGGDNTKVTKPPKGTVATGAVSTGSSSGTSSGASSDTTTGTPTLNPTIDNTSTSTTTVNSSTVNSATNRSTLTQDNTVPQTTVPVDATPVRMAPGTATNNAMFGDPNYHPSAPDSRNIKGTPQMGLSSFGFTAGMDDSITMMNTSYFTG